MDIQHLIERLEAVLKESRQVPLTAYLLVDQDRIYTILDQMRVSVPEVVKRASRIEAERERILAQSKEEAERIRELAKQEAIDLVNRDNIVANAHSHAQKLMELAQHEAAQTRQDADDYIMRVLSQLEQDLTRTLSIVRNGIHRLEYESNQTPTEPAGENAQAET